MDEERYEYYLREIGMNLNKARQEQNLSLKRVSEMSNTSSANLCRLEAGKDPNPSVKRLFKICSALGVELGDVVNVPKNAS